MAPSTSVVRTIVSISIRNSHGCDDGGGVVVVVEKVRWCQWIEVE